MRGGDDHVSDVFRQMRAELAIDKPRRENFIFAYTTLDICAQRTTIARAVTSTSTCASTICEKLFPRYQRMHAL